MIRFDNILRLEKDRVLVEQLRLSMGNMASSVIPMFLTVLLVYWALSDSNNQVTFKIWCAAAVLSNLTLYFHARHYLRAGIQPERARRIVLARMFLHGLDGFIWGLLVWLTLDTATLAGTILVFSIIAGIMGGTLSADSVVLPVFVVYLIAQMTVIAAKLWSLGDPAFHALGVAGVFYIVALLGQARNNYQAARSFIEMRFRNEELVEQLRIKSDVAEAAQLDAEQANAAKSKFLAAASHDLRQPIHAQGLFLEVLSRTEQTPQQRALLASARAASEAAGEMLNTLLDFSRIEAGVIEPQLQAFRLQPLLNKIETELATQADAKGIVYRSRETHLAARSDPVLVELILRNLVTNAIRYTHQGGVLVAARQRGRDTVLEVWDTGIGIAPQYQQEVFREFHQLGNPERDRQKGLGLGLAIAKGLAQKLGHELTLSSEAGRGSVFRLTMPGDQSLSHAQSGMLQSKTRVLNARLLVIDDDDYVRAGMCHLLTDWGCECQAVESVEEALAIINVETPELIISDYRLRDQRTGVEAINTLRARLGESLPALLITGDTAPERLREAQASGIPLMHKPVSPSQLYRKLVELLH